MSEKRYFKIFSERHTIGSQNKYVALFEQMDRTLIEDDKEIKANLENTGINASFLSADKNYLYQLILRSLNDFHHSKTFNIEIKEALITIEILFHKGLYQEALKLIAKAEILAAECENFQLRIDLLMWKKKCSGYSLGLKKAAEANTEIDHQVILLNNLKKITDLYYESNILQSNNEEHSKKEIIKRFEQIISKPELKQEKNALSFSAKIFYYLIYSNYYHVMDNKPEEYECLQKLVNILNASKTYSVENPLDYVSICNRLLAIKKFFATDTFFDDIKVLKEFVQKVHIRKEVVIQRVFVHISTHELEYYLINNDFQQALSKIKEIEKEISKLDLDIEPFHMIYFYYLHAVTLIFVGQYNKALKFINKIINDFTFDARPQIHIRVEILNAIVHFELKNESLVISLVKQILKKNKTLQLLIPVEEKLLETLSQISSLKHYTLKEEFVKLQVIESEISKLKSEKTGIGNSLLDNYDKWIKAKLKRKTVSEIY